MCFFFIKVIFNQGNIGDLHEADMNNLMVSIKEVLNDMGVKVPVTVWRKTNPYKCFNLYLPMEAE